MDIELLTFTYLVTKVTTTSFSGYVGHVAYLVECLLLHAVSSIWLNLGNTTTALFIRQNDQKPERATAHQSWLLVSVLILSLT